MPTQINLIKELSADSNNWYEKYPWFSLGQLVNIEMKRQNEDFHSTVKFGAIFFNDTQRLHWLLHEQDFNKNKILAELSVPISTEGMQTTPQPFPKREHPQNVTAPSYLIAVAAVEENDAVKIKTPASITHENILVDDVVIHVNTDDLKDVGLSETTNSYHENEVIVDNTSKQAEPPKIYIQQPEEMKAVEPIILQKEFVAEPIKEITKALPIEENKVEIDNIAEKIIEADKATLTADSTESVTKAQANIKAALDGGDAMDITFEPYHTIDYFASQGIKVDSKADDRLGKQLKSFTSWLKSMKRLSAVGETTSDTSSVQIHDKSLENTEVITEAMAAVLVKQGKKEQAIEIFKQLSLLHPEKSRYFAAQIEQIKN